MSTGRDDDALSWDGDDDPTLVAPRRSRTPDRARGDDDAVPVALPEGFTAVGKGSTEDGRIAPDRPVEPADSTSGPGPMSNVTLVTLGIMGGIFLLFTIGWVVGGLRLQGTADFLVSPVGYRFAFWLAVCAPALWFVAVLVLTRASKAWVRVLWLVAGLVLLVPWPFVMVGAVGQ